MSSDLTRRLGEELDRLLADTDQRLAREYPGDSTTRQPVHTVYVPGDRFDAATVASWGATALEALDEHAGSVDELAEVTGLAPALVENLLPRVRDKLVREPVEDLRVDFEDGYGAPPDDEEDAAAVSAADVLGSSVRDGTATPFHGIRFKSLERASRPRAVRTLWLFLETLQRHGGLTGSLVVTLPKVSAVEQVRAMVLVCARLEAALAASARSLRFEIQVETPQAVLGPDGTALVARMVHASDRRCVGLHYGTYDYSASCGIAAAHQSMDHPAADHAKAVMQVAAAGTGVTVSDGSTNVLPVGDRATVRDAWRLHARLVRRSLERGFYQGWDLHPAQLPTRYLATYGFYRSGMDEAAARLRSYTSRGASGFLDEPATAEALARFLLRGVECGGLTADEVAAATDLEPVRLVELARRRGQAGHHAAGGRAV